MDGAGPHLSEFGDDTLGDLAAVWAAATAAQQNAAAKSAYRRMVPPGG